MNLKCAHGAVASLCLVATMPASAIGDSAPGDKESEQNPAQLKEVFIEEPHALSPAGSRFLRTPEVPISGGAGSVLFAQAAQERSVADSSAREDEVKRTSENRFGQLDEVVVTGTHIRGSENTTSSLFQFDRTTIERSGYQTTEGFIRSIPQAFGGGAQAGGVDGNLGSGSAAGNNNEHATAVNLRGLGENDTLVLLNGHRMAPAAYGNVVDISTIPLSAVDHIDVLTDGASAIYGTDAVAGVVNIVLKSKADGLEARASYGGAAGGFRQQIYGLTFGTEWHSGSIMGTYEYTHQDTLSTLERGFTSEAFQPSNIVNPSTQNSAVVNVSQHFGDRLLAVADALATWKTTTNASARTATDKYTSFSDPTATNAHLDLAYAISSDWVLELAGTYAKQRTGIGFSSYLAPITLDQNIIFYADKLTQFDFNINGVLATLPGGALKLAVGASRRMEDASRTTTDPYFLPNVSFSRRVTGEFAEVYLPLIGEGNHVPFVSRLLLSAAVRHDEYSDFGGTTNPKVGLLWSPTASFDLRVNWSKAFRAPSAGELFFNHLPAPTVYAFPFASPTGSGTAPVFVLTGQNPHLGPEKATTFDVGFEFRPAAAPGLKLVLDYYHVQFHDRLFTPPFDANALLHPDIYGPLIGQLADDAASGAYLSSLEAQGYQFVDLNGTGSVGVRYTYPLQILNAAIVEQNGFDFVAKYSFAFGQHQFHIGANAALINRIDTQFAPGAVQSNFVNTYANPLRWRVRTDATWTRGLVEATCAFNFTNQYQNPYAAPAAPVASWTSVDLSAAYHMDASGWLPRDTTVRFTAINLFDRAPPYAVGNAAQGIHYDVGNASPLGRFLSAEVRAQW